MGEKSWVTSWANARVTLYIPSSFWPWFIWSDSNISKSCLDKKNKPLGSKVWVKKVIADYFC